MKNFDERYRSASRTFNVMFYGVTSFIAIVTLAVIGFIGVTVYTVATSDWKDAARSAGEIVGEFREGMER